MTWLTRMACAAVAVCFLGVSACNSSPQSGDGSASADTDGGFWTPDLPASVPFPYTIVPQVSGCTDLMSDAPIILREELQGSVNASGVLAPPALAGGRLDDGTYYLVEAVHYWTQAPPSGQDPQYYRRTIRISGGATTMEYADIASTSSVGIYHVTSFALSLTVDGSYLTALWKPECGSANIGAANDYVFETAPGRLTLYYLAEDVLQTYARVR